MRSRTPEATRLTNGDWIARAGMPTGLTTMPMSSSRESMMACLKPSSASHSSVAMKRVAIWTPSAPQAISSPMSLPVKTPPAAKTGILRPTVSANGFTAATTSRTRSASGRAVFPTSSFAEKPRCPPASAPSTTTKSGSRLYRVCQERQMSFTALAEETIGASSTSRPSANDGSSSGSPAPEMMASAHASTLVLT